MRFGKAEIPRLTPNLGGYVGLDVGEGNVITLINFRASNQAFPVIRADDILNGNYDPQILNDRIILVGNVAPSVQDLFSAASESTINQNLPLVYRHLQQLF